MPTPLVIDGKVVAIRRGGTLGYFHSDTPDSPFSNMYISPQPWPLYFKGQRVSYKPFADPRGQHTGYFTSVEQVFAFGKAAICRDKYSADKIYHTRAKTPYIYKRLGRAVQHYDDQAWQEAAPMFMHQAMLAKFTHDSFAHKALAATSGCELAETNPYDKHWGAGASIKSNFSYYYGQNKQGKLLMQTRHELGLDSGALLTKQKLPSADTGKINKESSSWGLQDFDY